jgi:hypothetical protein
MRRYPAVPTLIETTARFRWVVLFDSNGGARRALSLNRTLTAFAM